MASLEERCVALFGSTKGKFHTTASLSSALQVKAEELRPALIALYRTGLADRMVLIQGEDMTGFYGHREGVQPGTALQNNTKKGFAA